jgi:hypothetical protein
MSEGESEPGNDNEGNEELRATRNLLVTIDEK